jgi:hypothetical protein
MERTWWDYKVGRENEVNKSVTCGEARRGGSEPSNKSDTDSSALFCWSWVGVCRADVFCVLCVGMFVLDLPVPFRWCDVCDFRFRFDRDSFIESCSASGTHDLYLYLSPTKQMRQKGAS